MTELAAASQPFTLQKQEPLQRLPMRPLEKSGETTSFDKLPQPQMIPSVHTQGLTSDSPTETKPPVYTAEFTRQTEEFLTRSGVSTEYVNPIPIGQGANHVVFSLDEPGKEKRVLKIAKPSTLSTMTEGHVGEKEGYDQATSYFTDKYIPKTIVHKDTQTDFYCVVQDAVKGKELTNISIRNRPDQMKQLQEIVQMNNKLYKDKKITLDFIGMNGFTAWIKNQFGKLLRRKSEFPISNILVDEQGNLKIIDFEFFDLSHQVGLRRRFINWLGTTANRFLMKHYFDLDILK